MAQMQLNEWLKNPVMRNTVIGIGVAILIPVAVKYLAPVVRPLARSTFKAGLLAVEKGRETAAELGEIFDDLVAEVREELRTEREAAEALYAQDEAPAADASPSGPKTDAG
jgi:propanediol dehydratase small subunit